MADFTDEASETEELLRTIALNNRVKPLRPLGWCYNCEEKLAAQQLFCDADCGNDYNARVRHNAATNYIS